MQKQEDKKKLLRDLMLKNFGTEEKGNAVTKKGVPTMRKGFWSKNFAKR
jgi:hypothetical protein